VVIPSGTSAGVVGVDEDAISESQSSSSFDSPDNAMDVDSAPVKLVVVDGLCYGPKHCAYENCSDDLLNYHGEVFCAVHEQEHGEKCHICNCSNPKIKGTQACQQHQGQWKKYVAQHKWNSASGFCKITQRPTTESLPWIPSTTHTNQPHDEPVPDTNRKNYFTPSKFYCVETICAPCGVVIAWTKFPKAESPTNILAFLEQVFPTEESRPDYICVDKACLMLRTAIRNGSWSRVWERTTWFIVDTYHYINHHKDDELCNTWCNPAPSDGSAPNLVIEAKDKHGKQYFKHAFNTQVNCLKTIIIISLKVLQIGL